MQKKYSSGGENDEVVSTTQVDSNTLKNAMEVRRMIELLGKKNSENDFIQDDGPIPGNHRRTMSEQDRQKYATLLSGGIIQQSPGTIVTPLSTTNITSGGGGGGGGGSGSGGGGGGGSNSSSMINMGILVYDREDYVTDKTPSNNNSSSHFSVLGRYRKASTNSVSNSPSGMAHARNSSSGSLSPDEKLKHSSLSSLFGRIGSSTHFKPSVLSKLSTKGSRGDVENEIEEDDIEDLAWKNGELEEEVGVVNEGNIAVEPGAIKTPQILSPEAKVPLSDALVALDSSDDNNDNTMVDSAISQTVNVQKPHDMNGTKSSKRSSVIGAQEDAAIQLSPSTSKPPTKRASIMQLEPSYEKSIEKSAPIVEELLHSPSDIMPSNSPITTQKKAPELPPRKNRVGTGTPGSSSSSLNLESPASTPPASPNLKSDATRKISEKPQPPPTPPRKPKNEGHQRVPTIVNETSVNSPSFSSENDVDPPPPPPPSALDNDDQVPPPPPSSSSIYSLSPPPPPPPQLPTSTPLISDDLDNTEPPGPPETENDDSYLKDLEIDAAAKAAVLAFGDDEREKEQEILISKPVVQQESKPRRKTLLDLQAALSSNPNPSRSRTNTVGAIQEDEDYLPEEGEGMVQNKGSFESMSLNMGGSFRNRGRSRGSSLSKAVDAGDIACEENIYFRVMFDILPPPFTNDTADRYVAPSPSHLIAILENSISSRQSLHRAQSIRFQSGDIVVAGTLRCGQSSVLRILDQLLLADPNTTLQPNPSHLTVSQSVAFMQKGILAEPIPPDAPLPFRIPWIESAMYDKAPKVEDFAQVSATGRRVFKTHLKSRILRTQIKPGVKFVIVARDPIDLRLSHFRLTRKLYRRSPIEDVHPFDTIYNLDSFARVHVAPGGIEPGALNVHSTQAVTNRMALDDHPEVLVYETDLAEWIKARDENPGNVLILFYEDIVTNPAKVVQSLASFVQTKPGKEHAIAPVRIERAIKNVSKDINFPFRAVQAIISKVPKNLSKVQLRVQELERKERAMHGIRKIEQEMDPNLVQRARSRSRSASKSDRQDRQRAASRSRSGSSSARNHTRTTSNTTFMENSNLEEHARRASVAGNDNRLPGSSGCLQLGHRIFDDLDIEWLDDEWDLNVKPFISTAISYEAVYERLTGERFPFGHRDRPKKVLMTRALAEQKQSRKSILGTIGSMLFG